MADSSSIDRVFDLIDNFVDKADRVLNRTKYTEEQYRSPGASVKPVPKCAYLAEAGGSPRSTTVASRRFRIIEAIDATSGEAIFVVTNGSNARVECSTPELAAKLLRALEEAHG